MIMIGGIEKFMFRAWVDCKIDWFDFVPRVTKKSGRLMKICDTSASFIKTNGKLTTWPKLQHIK